MSAHLICLYTKSTWPVRGIEPMTLALLAPRSYQLDNRPHWWAEKTRKPDGHSADGEGAPIGLTLNSCSFDMTTGICRSKRGCFCFLIWFPSSSAKNQPCKLSSSDTQTHRQTYIFSIFRWFWKNHHHCSLKTKAIVGKPTVLLEKIITKKHILVDNKATAYHTTWETDSCKITRLCLYKNVSVNTDNKRFFQHFCVVSMATEIPQFTTRYHGNTAKIF